MLAPTLGGGEGGAVPTSLQRVGGHGLEMQHPSDDPEPYKAHERVRVCS